MSALDIQIGGEHYKTAKIQPIQYIEANGLGFLEGCVVKRITRHDKPTGKGRQDIEKAIHELQLLLEFRYPVSPDMTDALAFGTALHQALAARTNPPGGDIYAEFAARINATERKFGKNPTLGAGYGLVDDCPECGYPTDAAGTHYATCSQLTAPEEYKAEAQVAFDEAAGISEALARQVSAGTGGYVRCPHCRADESILHAPECPVTPDNIKARLAALATDIYTPAMEAEPAAAMDDDSARMQAIGQNGEMAEEVYAAVDAADPWAGAPDWAKYKAQDADGEWRWYSSRPGARVATGYWVVSKGRIDTSGGNEPNPNWRDTLITRT